MTTIQKRGEASPQKVSNEVRAKELVEEMLKTVDELIDLLRGSKSLLELRPVTNKLVAELVRKSAEFAGLQSQVSAQMLPAYSVLTNRLTALRAQLLAEKRGEALRILDKEIKRELNIWLAKLNEALKE